MLSVYTDGPLAYSLVVDGKAVVSHSAIELDLAKDIRLGAAARFKAVTHRTVDTAWTNNYGNNRNVRDHFSEVALRLKDHGIHFIVIARAYNEGAAFRLFLPRQRGLSAFTVTRDATEFAFPADARVWAGKNNAEGPSRPEGGFVGSQEWQFLPSDFAALNPSFKYGLPFLVHASGVYVAVTESDLLDWAGMWLQRKPGTASTMTVALAPPLPAAPWPARIQADRTASGVSDAPPPEGPVQAGFVVAKAPHNSPWRVFLVGRHPVDLLGTDLVLKLATPNSLADTSWVRPGMASWGTWWPGTGHNDLATIKTYIDLAAAMGWPYQLTEGRDRCHRARGGSVWKRTQCAYLALVSLQRVCRSCLIPAQSFPKYARMGVGGLEDRLHRSR